MRILYIQNNFGFGGINKITSVKENWLVNHGHEVHNLNMLRGYGVSPEGYYSEKIHFHDIKVSTLNKLNSVPIVGRLLRFFYLRMRSLVYLVKIRPDIIVSTQPPLEPLSIILFTFWKKRILEFHGWYNAIEKKDLLRRDKWYGKTRYKIYHIVCLTEREAKHLHDLFGCKAQVIPNANFVHASQYSECSTKQVLSLGRFSPEKNNIDFLPSWKEIQGKHPDWTFELYGSGVEEDRIHDIIRKNRLTSVHIHPYTLDVASAYLNASIFILYSRHEGFPLVLLESMAYGVPVIAYDCPCGPSEIIQSGVDGFVTEYKNPKAMVDKINYLIEHPDVRKEMGKKARVNIQRFNIDEIMGRWIMLFHQLIG